jgi:hypothetical protein
MTMAHPKETRLSLRAAFLGGLPIEQAAQQTGVPVQTARRWKAEAAESGDDWDRYQSASLIVAGGGFDQAMGRVAAAVVLRCGALLDKLEADEGINPMEATKAIASLTDSLNKAHAAAKRLMPETDRLAAETEALKAFADLLIKRNPDAGETVLSALEAFARGER